MMMQPQYTLTLDDIDLSSWDFWRRPRDEREGAFAMLRQERPMAFFPEGETSFSTPGAGYWAVTRYADVVEASRKPHIFQSAQGAPAIGDMTAELREFFGSMIVMDDPAHQRLRGLVAKGFTPVHLRKVEADVQTAAKRVFNRVIERGQCDFVTDLAAPFPIEIICDMMGIPASQYDFVFEQTNIILGGADPEFIHNPAERNAEALQAGKALYALMDDLRRHRQKHPSNDITSALVHAEVDGDRLTNQEIGSFFILLTAAGNETTRNAISHGLKALCDHPDQRALWQQDFETHRETAVEEIVRWASPVIYMRRTTACDTELGGQPLRAGEKVVLYYNSANRDEAMFPEPYRFDLTRSPNLHVGFGGPGPHFCLGANLARREIEVFFRELFTRAPDLETTGEPDWLLSHFIHGIKHLPCRFTPGPVVA
jgi:cytochrome P450